MNIPNWVLYELEGHRRPVARTLAFRDAAVECLRYVRHGRSGELLGILRKKVGR